MIILSVASVILAAILLLYLIIRTRCYDTPAWWLFRVLVSYALVCFVYLAYDTGLQGSHLEVKYLLIRMGCLALVIAMLMFWRLIRLTQTKVASSDFDKRIDEILKGGRDNAS